MQWTWQVDLFEDTRLIVVEQLSGAIQSLRSHIGQAANGVLRQAYSLPTKGTDNPRLIRKVGELLREPFSKFLVYSKSWNKVLPRLL
jgi:hypothetical protein